MNKVFRHVNCRNGTYAKTVQRFSVPDDFVPWSINFESYKPPHFESSVLKGKPWADPEIDEFKPKFNDLDGEVNRVSWVGKYEIIGGKPMNPFGRTGISGRGVLGRFGPNHAADPIVSTWKRDENKQIKKHPETKKPILRILCIERGDTGEIALPGGMVDPGEEVSVTLKREFIEEALNGKINESELDGFFSNGAELYKGYCDDPRNTDSAWMETVAVNFHDEDGEFLSQLKFEAGDDAVGIHWVDVDKSVKLYASHSRFIEETARLRSAHF